MIKVLKNGVEQDLPKIFDENHVNVKGLCFYLPTGRRIYLKGMALGIFTHFAEVKGVSLSIMDINELVKGVSIGLVVSAPKICKGVQIGLLNGTDDMKGLQIGLINQASTLNGVQLGLLNIRGNFTISPGGISVEDSPCYPTPLINIGWTNNKKKK